MFIRKFHNSMKSNLLIQKKKRREKGSKLVHSPFPSVTEWRVANCGES